MAPDQYHRFLEYWQDEKNSSMLYRTIAGIESNPKIAEFYQRLADTEQKHAEVWEIKISELGHQVPEFQPTWRTLDYLSSGRPLRSTQDVRYLLLGCTRCCLV